MSYPNHPHHRHPFRDGLAWGTGLVVPPIIILAVVVAVVDRPAAPRPAIAPAVHVESLPIPDLERLAGWELGLAFDACADCWATCCPWGAP